MIKFCLCSRLFASSLFLAFCLGLLLADQSFAQDRGIDGRFGHTALPTVGRNSGITRLELFPYIKNGDEQILFGDIRGFLSNEGNAGTNLTAGFRFLEPSDIFVLGINASYDFDQTSEETFQQLGLGLEGFTSFGSITSNFYFPVGNQEQILESTSSNFRFQGTQLVADTMNIVGVSMEGLDASIGFNLPTEFAEEHQMEATFGWYHFDGAGVPSIDGFKIQIDGQISPALSALTTITNDGTFGTNVTLGIDWRFGSKGLPEDQLEQRLRRFVDRNYNVVLSDREQLGVAVPVNSPITGLAFNVQHVYAEQGVLPLIPPGELAGAVESPWATVSAAQASGADLIVLHSGSVLLQDITLSDGQILVGEGVPFQLETANFGMIDLPTVSGNPNNIPVVLPQLTPTGNGIVLGNNSIIAGVMIDSPAGPGILADGVTGFSVENVTINSASGNAIEVKNGSQGRFKGIAINGGGQDGIFISDTSDLLTFEDISVSGVMGYGVNITGGYGTVDFNGDLTLDGNLEGGLRVAGLESIVQIDDNGTIDTGDDITTNLVGTALFENLNINPPAMSRGIHLEDNDGLISIAQLDVNTVGETALFVRDTNLLIINDGASNSVDAPAADVENSVVDIFLKSVSVDGGDVGISMKQTQGRMIILGDRRTNAAESGGLIQNTDVAVHLEGSGTFASQLLNYSGNKTVGVASNSELFKISQSHITGTTQQFVNATNLRALEIEQSTFDGNTLASQSGILYSVGETGGYVVRIANNIVRDTPQVFFDAVSTVGGEDATLSYIFTQNDIQMDMASAVAARLNWAGSVDANLTNNLLIGTNANQKGFEIITGDSSLTSTILAASNRIGFTGINGIAIDIDAGGPVAVSLSQNTVEFSGRDGIGFRASASKTSSFNLTLNEVFDNAGGATGILFPSLHDGSTVVLNGNVVDVSGFSTFVDRGIVINTVTGVDDPIVTLESSLNNAISGATTTLSVPAGNIAGRVIINGQILEP
ncbi:MAG: inverse autotransporter beta domain-containing protein [Planctomycetaceae bacterium]|nr:inverse autotransporter beta domain-containing protein [Planctomycetaceae bacterium]